MTQFTHEVLIDVTRLVGRLWKRRLPTGVDRVGIAYVEHYRAHARAAVRLAGHTFVLPRRESERLFQWLLNPGKRVEVVIIIAMALLTGWSDQSVSGRFFFNTGHSGLERDDYPDMLDRMQVFPIFVVHDLIPITHPEYCRAGERVRHIVRMNNVLRLASGVVVNSQATLNDLSSFADSTLQAMPPSAVGLLARELAAYHPASRPMHTRTLWS